MAPSNGTTSTPLKLVVTLPPNHSTLQWQPTMAPAWCHVQSAKVVRRPPPFLEVRTPIAIAIWGNIASAMADSEVLLAQLGPGIIEDTRYIPTKGNSRARNLQHGMISAVLFPSHAFSCCGLCSHLPMV